MSERTTVDLIEDWQTGFFLVLGIAVVGIAVGAILGQLGEPSWFVPGFLAGGVLAFLAYSYLRFGR